MIHSIKNTSQNTLTYNNFSLAPNETFIIYYSDINIYGNKIKLFKNNFIPKDMNIINYYIDNVLQSSQSFFTLWNKIINDNNINNYSDTAHFKLYQYINPDMTHTNYNPTIPPYSIDYKAGLSKRLHQKLTFKKGFLVECEYFSNCEIQTDPVTGINNYVYSDPILKCNMIYTVGTSNYVSHRYVNRTYQTYDNTYTTDTKTTYKIYNALTARNEGIRRRTNITNEIVVNVAGLLLLTGNASNITEAETLAIPMLSDITLNLNKYINGDTEPLIDQTEVISYSWLDDIINTSTSTTIRLYMLSKLNDYNCNDGETIS